MMNDQVALITGASSGIGMAISETLAKQGFKLILLARRQERLEQLAKRLRVHTSCHVMALDLNDHLVLEQALAALKTPFSPIDVLVNCAGLALGLGKANQVPWSDWQTMITTNCIALSFLTHQLLPQMIARDHGHIINIGSIAGTYPYPGGNVYGATKAFVKQFTLNLKAELLGTRIRVTDIEPGMVGDSEFSLVRFAGDQAKADAIYAGINYLKPEDIADAVRWVLLTPAHVNINRIEMMPVAQAPARTAYHVEN